MLETYGRACRLERALHGQAVTGEGCLVFIFIQSPGRELSTLIVNIIINIQPTKIPSQTNFLGIFESWVQSCVKVPSHIF